MSELRRLAVFCGSRHGRDPVFRRAAEELAALLLERRVTLVYGGGDVGLMGVIADGVMDGGGEVIGVIPENLVAREVAHDGLSELHVVGTMHERKEKIFDLSDAVVAMPGGIGTFDELFEALTWNQLGIHHKPCGLLNVEGYYDPMVAMLERCSEQQFIGSSPAEMLAVDDDTGRLLDELARRL